MKKEKTPKQKAVVLAPETHAKLTQLCQTHGSNMKEFTAQMVTYFEKTGIDPTEVAGTDLKEAIKQLRKENNRVIGFIKQQEKEKLTPILDELAAATQVFRHKSAELDRVRELSKQLFHLRTGFDKEIAKYPQRLKDGKYEVYRSAVLLFKRYLEAQEQLKKKNTFGGEQIKLEELATLNATYQEYFKRLNQS